MDNEDKKNEENDITVLDSSNDVDSDKILDANTTLIERDQDEDTTAIAVKENTNLHLRRLISSNYIEYASYVIKERAIPDVSDGMKPVQRRILWSMYKMDDGKFHKVANIVGHTMQYHPHGDASIYMALVNLANKEYFIEKQGNFGNILTGDAPAAARYIEARLTPLAREVLFNPDITDFIDSYDGRNKEPVFFPAKVPALLMTGQEGIAPGMTTNILPHNFTELLEAQIAVLKNESFELYPDFLQGGIMNVSDYQDGNGKILLRAKVDLEGRKLIIREIPAMTTTEKLIASIEKAVSKNKIKVTSINDYTAENVEIEIVPARGYKPEKTLKLLYAYTDCSMSISSSLLVIKDNRPVIMTVSDVLKYNTECLVYYLRRELQIELDNLNEKYHEKTLERIFIENRIYKRIEECRTYELVLEEVRNGLSKFIDLLKREITDKDIERLLAIPIRRISLFDMEKNKKDIDDILITIDETEKNLKAIIKFTIRYIESLIKKFAANYPRKTEIEEFEKVDVKEAALNNIKVGWDRKNSYIGTSVKSDEVVACNEFDNLHCIDKKGKYKIIGIPQKLYVGKLFYFNKYNKDSIFSIVYKDKKSNVYYIKRCIVDKFIRDKEYNIIPDGCQLELITTRERTIYECTFAKTSRQKIDTIDIDFSKVQLRTPAARGFRFTDKKILKFRFKEQVEYDEIIENSNNQEEAVSLDKKPEPVKLDKNPVPRLSEDNRINEANAESGNSVDNQLEVDTKISNVPSDKIKNENLADTVDIDSDEKSIENKNHYIGDEKAVKVVDITSEDVIIGDNFIESDQQTNDEVVTNLSLGKDDSKTKENNSSEKSKSIDEVSSKKNETIHISENKKSISKSKKTIKKISSKSNLIDDSSNASPISNEDNKIDIPPNAANEDDELDNDWGIIQPDLGF